MLGSCRHCGQALTPFDGQQAQWFGYKEPLHLACYLETCRERTRRTRGWKMAVLILALVSVLLWMVFA